MSDIRARADSLMPNPELQRILIVEDDQDIAELVAHQLVKSGYEVDIVSAGDEVLPALERQFANLVVLDLMLPGLSGLDVCRAIRAHANFADIPIIMVTAKTEETDRIVGLELGGDDYITKPFSPKELTARVGAVLRRTNRTRTTSETLTLGSLSVDLNQHTVSVDGRDVRLTAKEFLLLKYLIEHKSRVLSRDVLLSDVWGYSYTGGTRTVDVHVRRLREKIPVLSRLIVTVKQFGYKLVNP